ncbi:zinc transporter 10 isoform X2 [Xenopus laevis]|uniref:Zinc transporter 10 isoform X2 n=1 Tax=Xenopus laevis TaxID=8355 RepID=A0A8J1KVB9_XENLA|nr:zinc transporter 10 isoform X2 [Xenopus laevis]
MSRYTGRAARLIFMCVVSFFLFIAELAIGYIGNSLSLSSDAFAVLSHLISMLIGLVGVRLSRVQWHKRSTFGFLRADAVGAFGNSIFAAALMFSILIEAIKRYIGPEKTENALLVLIAGIVGLAINVLNYLIFMDCCFPKIPDNAEDLETGDAMSPPGDAECEEKKQEEKKAATLNIRGVMLHVMGDALGSVVVVVTAVIFYVLPLAKDAPCNWQCYIDPSLTVVMVGIILFSAFPLIKETANILLQMVPEGVQVGEIGQRLSSVSGVKSVHEIHIWELASGKNIATLHVKFQDFGNHATASQEIRRIFHEEGIHAVTIQAEFPNEKDLTLTCSAPCISEKCDTHLCCSRELVPYSEIDGKTLKKGKSSQVWYRSNDLAVNVDAQVSVEPLCEEEAGLKMKEGMQNGFTVEKETQKSTHL